jgi:hypothetical protein
MANYQVTNKIKFFLNFHEAGEGRCNLDRYFGYMVALEKQYMLREADIVGMDIEVIC